MLILQKSGENEVWYNCEDLSTILAYVDNKSYHIIVVRVVVELFVAMTSCINNIPPAEWSQ